MARKKKIKKEEYNEEFIDEEREKLIASKELVDYSKLYDEDDSPIDEDSPIEDTQDLKHQKRIKRAINIVFIVLIALMVLVSIDVICVAKYEKGPYFAIKTNTYKDGGTKVYYGLGYKVIKYHQVQGRRDTDIGFWSMPYTVDPTETTALDLAIEFQNDAISAYQRLYKSFLRVSGTYLKTDKDKNMVISYVDPDGSYTLNIICHMADDAKAPTFEENKEITILGTLRTFNYKTEKTPNTIHMSDCFAEEEIN